MKMSTLLSSNTVPPDAFGCMMGLTTLLGAVAAASFLRVTRTKSRKSPSRLKRWHFVWTRQTFWIQNVRIPVAVLPETFRTKGDKDEGLVDCHVRIEAGKIAEIVASSNAAEKDDQQQQARIVPSSSLLSWLFSATGTTTTVNGHGCLFFPCFVDAHTHLVKTQIVPRLRNQTGTMGEAIAVELQDQALHWSDASQIQRLMDFGIQCAVHHGTKALRTHLDGCAADDPSVVQAVYQAYDQTVVQCAAQGVTLQGVANLFLPQWRQEPLATEHADRAAQHANTVLGAYVGNPSSNDKVQTVEALKALLAHAQRCRMDVDLHVDESNDVSCCALLSLVGALGHARQRGYKGKVVLGHCCALSLQDEATQQVICRYLAELKNVYVVANPFTNLGLQDRRGSKRPFGTDIPADVPRTPQWRGLTIVQELEAAGVTTAVASDNVRDHWYSFGDFDLLSVWGIGLQLLHLDTIPSAGAWAHLCTDAPARAMGLSSRFALGEPADGILFPRARRVSELLARPQMDRIVIRNGKVQTTSLPDFADLDDLVANPTPRPPPEAFNFDW